MDGNTKFYTYAYVKNINPAFVTIEMYKKGGKEEKLNSNLMFCVELTEEEFKNKYYEKAVEVLKNIQNKLCLDEIGYHEIWNGWLSSNPYDMASYCCKENIRIVGYSSDIQEKYPMFGNEILDIGVCAEYENGERFWCHFSSKNLEKMLKNEENKQLLASPS